MKLDDFFATVAPLLTGRAGLSQTAARLYGEEAAGARRIDAERLGIYARFCRLHRFEAVDSVYSACRAAVLRAAGEGAWAELVEGYFRAHPMRSFELNENGAQLPAYLAAQPPPALPGLPAYLPELADFEWWEWQTQIAPDAAEDKAPERGPLRLGATVELRPYGHDFVTWLDEEDEARPADPEARETLVLFWRDRELRGRRDRVSPVELLVLRTVHEGGTVEGLLSQGTALPREHLEETVADLRQAGILLGQP